MRRMWVEGIYELDGVTLKGNTPYVSYSTWLGIEIEFEKIPEIGGQLITNHFYSNLISKIEEDEKRMIVTTADSIYVFNNDKVKPPDRELNCEHGRMDIYTPAGYKVRFTHPDSGWGYDVEKAKRAGLVYGEVYTVKKMVVHRSSSEVHLEEFPDTYFNPVQFENVID